MPEPADLPRAARASELAFWLLIGVIASVGAGKAVLSDTLDPDLFWHLKVAEQLRADGVGPIVDRLSYNSIPERWTPYSWLAEMGMKWAWDHLGWRSTVAGEAVMVVGIVFLIAAGCRALAGPERKLTCVLATAFGAYLSIPYLSFRPVTLAILILALVAWLLLRERRDDSRRTRCVWLIVPLTALLTNVHLAVVLVPIWVGCLLVGAIWERRDVRRYAVMLALVTLACLATPMLPGAARAAWFYQSRDVMVASDVIAEMRPIWRGVAGAITMAMLIVLAAFALRNRARLRAGEWLWLLAATLLTFRLAKFTPMFALIAGPVLAATFPRLNDRVLSRPIVAGALAVALLVSMARIVVGFPSAATPMDWWVNRRVPIVEGYPTAAAAHVEQHLAPRSGRLINEFNWGGYLAWRLGDEYQVFVDGRTQLYPPQFWQKVYLGSDDDLLEMLRESSADAAIVPIRKSRFRPALERLGWRSVYRDNVAEVLIPAP